MITNEEMMRMFAELIFGGGICPRHVPPSVLCGEGTTGKLADSPPGHQHHTSCGNLTLGHTLK